MSDTMTLHALREAIKRLPGLDGDYTNVTEIRILPEFERVQLVTTTRMKDLGEVEKRMMSANTRLEQVNSELKKTGDKLATRLRHLRRSARIRKPNLP
jgi:hypothetical protein